MSLVTVHIYWENVDLSFNILFKRLWIMQCLPNLNHFSEESINDNTPCSINNRILRMKKILCEKLCLVINTGSEWIYILTRTKITPVQDMWQILLWCNTTPWFHRYISFVFWQSILSAIYLLILCMPSTLNV